MNLEQLSATTVDAAYHIYRDLGPGLLESVYETLLAGNLTRTGLTVERQKKLTFVYDGTRFDDGLKVDILVDRQLIVEVKSVETIAPVHAKQLLTYLRLSDIRLGLLINFGAGAFRLAVKRVANEHRDTLGSRLRVNRR